MEVFIKTVLIACLTLSCGCDYTIGAFNNQTFGKSKYSKDDITNYLIDIVLAYDLILIQEIKDSSETIIYKFLGDCQARKPSLDMIVSPRLGRNTYKEQYAIVFDTTKFTIEKHTVYNNPNDLFARPPIIAHFSALGRPKISDFTVFGVHIDPDDVVQELDDFPAAYEYAISNNYPSKGIFMGDMNADCLYLSATKYNNLKMVSDDRFTWLNDNKLDTTVSLTTDCFYDRIVLCGNLSSSAFSSPNIDKFDVEMSNEVAKQVSDHYPVYVTWKEDGLVTSGSASACLTSAYGSDYTIGAFNIQTFGKTKYFKYNIKNYLIDIVLAYDLILIQEIKDYSETIIYKFLGDCQARKPSLDMIVSPRLGRTTHKEQYAIVFDTTKFNIEKHTVYNNPNDIFARPPIIAHFSALGRPKISDFTVFGVHIDPDDVVQELDDFPAAYEYAISNNYPSKGIFMGDMNADCRYLSATKYNNLKMVSDDRFTWLNDNKLDTTVSLTTDCFYDRIVLCGNLNSSAFSSPNIDKFDAEMSNEVAKQVSDHYPVYVTWKEDGLVTSSSASACLTSSYGSDYTIGAFNIQTFGKSKYSKDDIKNYLIDIVLAYDLILIQEIKDYSETIIYKFLGDCQARKPSLDMIVSPRLGRTTYKEQYAIIFDTTKFNIEKHTVYNNPNDLFARPPIIAHFSALGRPKIPDFTVFGVHIDPDDVVQELDDFPAAYEYAISNKYPSKGIFMGDMNADCRYLSATKYNNLKMVSDDRFTWLNDNKLDTTVSLTTDCFYDRIVLCGNLNSSAFSSPNIDKFDVEMSNEVAKRVSDHYPVYVTWKGDSD